MVALVRLVRRRKRDEPRAQDGGAVGPRAYGQPGYRDFGTRRSTCSGGILEEVTSEKPLALRPRRAVGELEDGES